VKQVPQVAITSPQNDGAVITELPLEIVWDYVDVSGTQQSAEISILRNDGALAYRKQIKGPQAFAVIAASEFLPQNADTYLIKLSVLSTSTLSAITQRSFQVDYTEPAVPSADIVVDETRGTVELVALEGEAAEEVPETTSLSVFRRNPNGRLIALASQLSSGVSVVDVYPPVGQDIDYLIVAYTLSGVSSVHEYPLHIDGKGAFFINYGEGFSQVAKLSIRGDLSLTTQKDVVRIPTAGTNPDPLSFRGYSAPMSGSVTGTAWRYLAHWPAEGDPSTYADIKRANDWRGSVIVRLCSYEPFLADIETSFTDGLVRETLNVSVSFWKVRAHDGLVL
jgi:hypothetical protein